MIENPTLTLKAKKLGVCMRAARQSAGRSIQECAERIGVSEEVFEAYEQGDRSPSLPELEMLAYFFEMLMEIFWDMDRLLEGQDQESPKYDPALVLPIRQRMIGVLLRKARIESGFSAEDLAQKVGISPAQLTAYEFAETPIPTPELEVIAVALGYQPRHFQDQHGPMGLWFTQQRALRDFKEMPPELQAFVSRPVNTPYLELAQRLSEMSVEKLRSVAEGLLEITL